MKSTGSQISGNYVYSIIKEGKIIVCDGKSTRILRPYGDKVESYLWTAVSPDGSKIVTYAIGVGTVVLDMQGNILPNWATTNPLRGMATISLQP